MRTMQYDSDSINCEHCSVNVWILRETLPAETIVLKGKLFYLKFEQSSQHLDSQLIDWGRYTFK